MRKSRFTEEQIIGVLKAAAAAVTAQHLRPSVRVCSSWQRTVISPHRLRGRRRVARRRGRGWRCPGALSPPPAAETGPLPAAATRLNRRQNPSTSPRPGCRVVARHSLPLG